MGSSTNVEVSGGSLPIFAFSIATGGATGVRFSQSANGQDIEASSNVPSAIDVKNIFGNNDYVDAGNSPITISVNGNISVAASSSYAIRASRTAGIAANAQTLATNITISTANITAGGGGIWTRSKGNVSITAGNITASGKPGISVNNDEANTSSTTVSSVISVNVSSITYNGNAFGMGVIVSDVTISANIGSITNSGTNENIGIYLSTGNASGNNPITFTLSSANTSNRVIFARTNRTGTFTFSVTGAVTSAHLADITSSGDISVSTNSFSARPEGIGYNAITLSGKNVTVNTSGTINARRMAVDVNHSGNATISVTGDMTGEHTSGTIFTTQATSSSTTNVVTITTTGDINNTNTGALGVIRSKGNVGGRVTVSTKNVTSSGYYAINIDSNNGPVSITTAGAVKATGSSTSKDIAAIKIDNTNSSSTASPTATIVLNSGSVIGTTGKGVIVVTKNQAAAQVSATVTVNSGASMVGFVKLGEGNDEIKFNGGSYTLGASQKIDGGSHTNDNDVLNFNSGTWTVTASNFTNWETLKISSSGTAKFLGKGTGSGQDLGFDSVVVDGVLSLQDGTVGDHLDIEGNLSGSGVIHVDVNFTTKTSDRVVVSGTVTGNIKIRLNDVTPSGSQHVVDTKVRILSLTGTGQNASVFSLENSEFLAGGYKYTITVTSNRHIELNSTRSVLRCTESSSVTGVFSCAGTISTPEYISKTGNTNISATLASGATVTVSSFKAISMVGSAAVTFTQAANGGSINATGNASGAIDASTTGNGAVNVTLTGTANLQGSGTAVRAFSSGTGAVSVRAVQVNANNASATAIEARGSGSSVSVSTTGTVSGGKSGITAFNHSSGTGSVTVSASRTVTGSSATAIYALNRGTGGVSVTTSAVNAGTNGIDVRNFAGGAITIVANGAVAASGSGDKHAGIFLNNDASGGAISVAVGSNGSLSGHNGVFIDDKGGARVTVNATGNVTGVGGDGVYVNKTGSGGVSVTASALIAGTNGIDVRNFAGGAISVVANGAVTANGSGDKHAGIFLNNDASGGAVSVTVVSNGSLSGHNGVFIDDKGGAGVTVNATGNVTGVAGDGVYIEKTGSGSVLVNVGQVTGKKRGVFINHTSTGTITATATKLVRSTANAGAFSGVEVINSGDNIDLVLAGVTGAKHGVEAKTTTTGSISIVTSGAITGQTDGIRAFVEGQGNVSVTVSGNITSGDQGFALNTKAGSGTTTIVINGGDIGGQKSIKNLNGSSVITVNNTAELKGDVELGGGEDQLTFNSTKFNSSIRLDGGEDVSTDSSIDSLTFSSGTVTAVAANLRNWERITVASGATLKFNASNTVTAEELRLLGTLSLQDGDTNDRLITTGNFNTLGNNVTGTIAIDVNFATGASDTITVRGSMTGRKQLNVRDITPSNNSNRTENPISIITVTGTVTSNALTLNTTRIRSGGYFYTLSFDSTTKSFRLLGVAGVTNCQGTSTAGTFNCSGAITALENIIARGNENLIANLTRLATVSVSSDVAISMSGKASVTFTQEANGGALTASGTASGVILASTTGNGAVSVQLTGTATLTGAGSAIKATSTGNGNVTITAANVVASNAAGIAIEAEGRGRQVSVNASTTSGGRNGIVAKNTGTNGSVTINATGSTTGGTVGIDATTTSGSITVNATSVLGGVVAKNAGGTGNVSVTTTGNVTGSRSVALDVENLGRGTIAVTTSATVTATAVGNANVNAGSINVNAGANVTSVTISANNVSGVHHAVRSINNGSGPTSIMLNGTVQSQSASAIHAQNSGTGAITITLAGAVTGGTQGAAIDTLTDGGATNITLNSGAVITGTIAIRNDEGASVVNVNSGASISGAVRLGAGADTLTFAEPTFGTSILDGGDDSGNTQPEDILTFNGGTFSATMTQERWLNWEKIVVGNQATVSFSGSDNHVDATDFDLKGTVSLQNGTVQDGVTFRSNLVGGGIIKLDANFYTGSADLVNIVNNVTGTTQLDIRDVSTQTGGEEDKAIVIVDVSGTASASAFEIMRNPQSSGAYDYELTFNSTDTTFSVRRKHAASSVMLVATPIALLDGFTRAPTLYERRTADSNAPYWSRVFSRNNGYGTAREGSAEYESSNTGFQIGYDLATTKNDFGTVVYGATIQYNSMEVDVSAFNVAGTYTAKGFGIGGTATVYMKDGTYVDTQLQYNQVSADFEVGNSIGTVLDGHESTAMLLSAEVGKRYSINDEYTLLYSGQLNWGNVDGGNTTTARGQSVDFGGDSNLTLRGGARIEYKSDANQFYGLANLYIDTLDSWDITFATETFSDSKGTVLAEIGFGGEVELSPTSAWFGQAAFKTSLKGGVEKRDSTYLSTGIRWSW